MREERLKRAVPAEEFIAKERALILSRQMAAPVLEMYRSSISLSPQWREKFYAFWSLPADFEL
jgi:hypothetical protein